MTSAIQNPPYLKYLHLLCTSVISCGSNVEIVGEKAIWECSVLYPHLWIWSLQKTCTGGRGEYHVWKKEKLDIRSPQCFLKEGGDNTRICEVKMYMSIHSFLFMPPELCQHISLQWVLCARLPPQIVLTKEKVAGQVTLPLRAIWDRSGRRGLLPLSTGASGWPPEYLQVDHVAVIQSFTVYALDQLPISII